MTKKYSLSKAAIWLERIIILCFPMLFYLVDTLAVYLFLMYRDGKQVFYAIAAVGWSILAVVVFVILWRDIKRRLPKKQLVLLCIASFVVFSVCADICFRGWFGTSLWGIELYPYRELVLLVMGLGYLGCFAAAVRSPVKWIHTDSGDLKED